MKKFVQTMIVTASLATVSVTAHGLKDAEGAIEYRQAVFHLVAAHFGQMGAMVKGKKEFSAEEFDYRAESLKALSLMPLEGFTFPGADKGDFKAKPAVWKDMDAFKAKLSTFQEDAAALAEATKSGSMDTIKPAFLKTAKNCKGCHSDFKFK